MQVRVSLPASGRWRARLATALLALSSGAWGGAGDPVLDGELMVKLSRADALAPLLLKYRLSLLDRFGARPIFRLRIAGTASLGDTIAALSTEPAVQIVEPNAVHRSPEARKNNVWAIGSAGAYAAQWAPQAMRLPEAQTVASGAGVRVAVLDTGVDATHPALAGRLMPGFDFVDFDADPSEAGSAANPGYGHGTHVAGLVAMAAPGARIVPLRVLDAQGEGNAWVLAEALLHAVDPDGNPATDDGAQVVNLSLGSLSRTRLFDTIALLVTCSAPEAGEGMVDFSDPGYNDDKQRCTTSQGAVIVAAAGNDASKDLRQYPAAETAYGKLAVTASTPDRRLAAFGNFGSWIDLAAPGEAITSSVPGAAYGTWSGTSMATPLVAGTAALLRSAHPELSARDTVRRLLGTTAPLCGTKLRQIDAAAALGSAAILNTPCP